jgi:insertion element IS1 protein InsB
MWSFVNNKGNKQWVWLALDVETREIVGVYIGARNEVSAQCLWDSLPGVYRQCAMAYTDGTETGKTSYIKRFNHTLRQRVSRLVRKTLSFSKSLENHIGAIWSFIHDCNASLLV